MCGSLRSDESVLTLSVSYTNKWNGNQTSKACFAVFPECYWVAVFSIEDNDKMEEHAVLVKMLKVKGLKAIY